MNERELLICSRVAAVRARAGWSQTDLAKLVGTTRDGLATVEYGRTPLRFWLADRICQELNVCQRWLAEGKGSLAGYVGVPPEIMLEIAQGELFSAAYERRLGHFVKRQVLETEALARAITDQAGGANRLLQDRLYNLAICWFQRIPPHLYDQYFRELMALSSEFFQQHRSQFETESWPPPPISPSSDSEKKMLPATSLKSNTGIVNIRTLDGLRAALRANTSKKGEKAALANLLQVPQARVSEWLSGKKEPGGETTLRLLHWVEQQKCK
jgi:transcriptional regulator with XRE-family HTH domain